MADVALSDGNVVPFEDPIEDDALLAVFASEQWVYVDFRED